MHIIKFIINAVHKFYYTEFSLLLVHLILREFVYFIIFQISELVIRNASSH